MSDADKLRTLATWFDHFDDWREATRKIAPGIAEYREVQTDLRRIAATLDAARTPALDVVETVSLTPVHLPDEDENSLSEVEWMAKAIAREIAALATPPEPKP